MLSTLPLVTPSVQCLSTGKGRRQKRVNTPATLSLTSVWLHQPLTIDRIIRAFHSDADCRMGKMLSFGSGHGLWRVRILQCKVGTILLSRNRRGKQRNLTQNWKHLTLVCSVLLLESATDLHLPLPSTPRQDAWLETTCWSRARMDHWSACRGSPVTESPCRASRSTACSPCTSSCYSRRVSLCEYHSRDKPWSSFLAILYSLSPQELSESPVCHSVVPKTF